MRSPIDFEKAHHYDPCRESFDSDDYPSPYPVDEAEQSLTNDTASTPPPPPYSAYSLNRRRFILAVVTAAGFFGPLCGAIYLPSLKLFQTIYSTSETAVNGTVSMYMVVFAVAVCEILASFVAMLTITSLSLVQRPLMSVDESLFTWLDSAASSLPTHCLLCSRHTLDCCISSGSSRVWDHASSSPLEQVQ